MPDLVYAASDVRLKTEPPAVAETPKSGGSAVAEGLHHVNGKLRLPASASPEEDKAYEIPGPCIVGNWFPMQSGEEAPPRQAYFSKVFGVL